MGGAEGLLAALPFAFILVVSGLWAERRYRRFRELPGHYGLGGHVTRMGSRRAITVAIPLLFALFLVVFSLTPLLVPPENQNGSIVPGVIFSGVVMVAAYGLVVWLTERWVSRQRDE